ncbi:unnamed protein product [Mytilus edulis]|uniref:Endonuclease/exonuclease/phosphatase domain-containing protein n=1 Tax=Mytilus edulis TaxID=6550 RepID=A0A8S3UT61_MYTED|nr:unnamed protein product [Mytilus edulis]
MAKKTPYSIHQQFPSEIEDRRRKLYPIQKEAKYSGKHTVLVRDKLFIDGKQYILDESMEHDDMRSDNPRSDNPYSYRDSLFDHAKRYGQAVQKDETVKPNANDDQCESRRSCDIDKRSYFELCNDLNVTDHFTAVEIYNLFSEIIANFYSDFLNDDLYDRDLNSSYSYDTSGRSPSVNSTFNSNHVINDVNILCLNCCGIKSRMQYPEFENIIKKHDIVCFVETKTDDIDVINFPGFHFKMKNRKTVTSRRSGGIIVGYTEKLKNMIEIKETDCKYVLWFQVNGKVFNLDKPVVFGVVYIPPEYTKYSSDEALNQIEHEYLRFSNYSNYICLLGDFNARTGCDDDYVIIDENEHGDNNLSDFIENPVNALKDLSFPIKRKHG